MKQHKTEVRYGNMNNDIARHEKNTGHAIVWAEINMFRDQEKGVPKENRGEFPHNENYGRCTNIADGCTSVPILVKGAKTWLDGRRKER